MKPVLIYIRPLDQRAGQRIDIRVADGPNADTFGVGGVPWEPAVLVRPRMSIELMSPDMDGRVQAGTANFEIALGNLMTRPRAKRLYWRGASVVIHNTGALEGSGAVPDFWGYVTSSSLDEETGRLTVTAQVSTALIEKPLLTGEFTGGGGLAGDPAKRGVLFPTGFGYCRNIQPVWFDTTRNIGMIDGYGNTLSIDWLAEGLSSFGARVADYPDYAALAAAIDNKTIKPGQWGTCVAQGLVGLGAPPTGIITVHAHFGCNRIGAMMKRILLTHAKVPVARVDGGAFDILDIQVPADVHFWTDQQRNVKDLIEALAQSCNATPLVSFQNLVTVTRAVGGPVVATLDRSGSIEPRVTDWQRSDVDPPYYLLKARGARPASVLTDDQVNYVDTLEDKGVFNNATVYSAGNLVWLADGSQWLYQNATPAAGHVPPSSKAPDADGFVQDDWWFRRQPPKTASDFTYQDGTPIEALKPRQSGADPTASNTAAAISGQAPAATDPSIQPGATRDVALTGREDINDRPGYYLDTYPGRTVVEAKRPSALGLTGTYADQGVLTTIVSSIVRQTFYEYGTGRSWMRNNVDANAWTAWAAVYSQDRKPFFGGDLLEGPGGALAALEAFKTIFGISSGFTGQGALATLSQLALGSNFLTGFGAFAGLSSAGYGSPYLTGFGALSPLSSIAFGTDYLLESMGGPLASLGGFKTALGTAAAIFGQGWGATALRPALDNSFVAKGANLLPNSDQTGAVTTWSYDYNPEGSDMRSLQMADTIWGKDSYALSGKTRNVSVYQEGRNGAGDTGVGCDFAFRNADGTKVIVTAAAGDRFIYSLYVAQHRCNAQIYAYAMNADGSLSRAWISPQLPATSNPTNILAAPYYNRHFVIIEDIPAGTTGLMFWVRKNNTYSVDANSFMWWAAPMCERAGPSQTEPSPYVSGPPSSVRDVGFGGDLDATNTGRNTAAGIFGQGALATLSSLANGSSYLTGFGALSSLGNVMFGSSYLLGGDGNVATDGGYKTSLGTAAAFSGQTAWATYTGSTGRVAQLDDSGYMQAQFVYLNGVAQLSQRWPAEGGANVTETRTASAISGQSAWATSNILIPGVVANQVQYLSQAGILGASKVTDSGTTSGRLLSSYFPATSGADRTSNATSAGFAGQGSLATKNAASYGSDIVGLPIALQPGNMIGGNYVTAQNVGYNDGQYNLETYKPAQAGADVTSTRTAAAIAGQSQLATAPFGLNQAGAIEAGNIDNYGVGRLSTYWPQDVNSNRTEARTSAAIAGQSAFATASGINRDNLFSAGFFALNAFSLGYSITRSDGATTVTESLVLTQLGISAGFVGQGGLATRNNVNLGDIVAAGLFTSRSNGQGRGFELDNAGLRSYSDNGTLTVELAF